MKRIFQGAIDTDAVLKELIRLAVTRSGSDRGCVAYARGDGNIRVTAAHGWSHDEAERFVRALGPTLDVALKDNRPLGSNNTREDSRFRAVAEDSYFRTRSVVLLPLTLIASIFGMNVHGPGEGESGTFFAIILLMALVLVALVLVFRRRGWL